MDTVLQMDEVVVSATRTEAKRSRLPFSVDVLKREDIQQRPSRTLPEAMFGMPGVSIQKTNHAGGSPFVRGLTGNQTLIMVDGIRLNNAIFRYGPNQYLTLIDPEWADRIEVLKGTGSVQYGSDAMTGVIHVLTRMPSFSDKPVWRSRTTGRIASSGIEAGLRSEIMYSKKRIAFLAGGSVRSFGDLPGGDTTGFQRPSGYRERSFDAKLRADLGRGWMLTASFQHLLQSGVPVYHKYVLENFAVQNSDPIGRSLAYARMQKSFKCRVPVQLNVFGAWQYMHEDRFSRKQSSKILRWESDQARTFSAGADMSLTMSKSWQSNTGVEIYNDHIDSRRTDTDLELDIPKVLRGLYPDDSRYLQASVYHLHHLRFKRFHAEAGIRYGMYRAKLTDNTLGDVVLQPRAWVFQGGINYQLTGKLNLFLHASEGFRAPNIDDLGTLGIIDFRYEKPAYDLAPEKTWNTELGIRYSRKAFQAQASVFRTSLRNLITRVMTSEVINGYNVYMKQNVEKGFIHGHEWLASWKLSDAWKVSGHGTYLFGQSITRNEPLRRIPPFTARLALEYAGKPLRAGIFYDHADAQKRLDAADRADNRIPSGGTPGFDLLHAYVAKDVWGIGLRLHLINIFNADYRTHGSGINGQGRSVLLSAVTEF